MVAAAVGAAAATASAANSIANSGGSGPAPTGTTTQTSTSSPWGPQQPYLLDAFSRAHDLAFGKPAVAARPAGQFDAQGNPAVDGGFDASGNPQAAVAATAATDPYFPTAGFTPQQTDALGRITNIANAGTGATQSANNYLQNLQNGAFISNPNDKMLAAIASGAINGNPSGAIAAQGVGAANTSLGQAQSELSPWANGQALNNPGNGYLSGIAGGGASANNPANASLGYLSSGVPTDVNGMAGSGALGRLASGVPTNANRLAGAGTLNSFANGDMLSAGNPYFSGLAASLGASVVPQIQAQFVNGGSMSNPAAAFATSQGLAAALAPYMEQNYNSGQDRMLQAGQTLGSNQLQGLGLQANAASTLNSNQLAGLGLQNSAAGTLGSQFLGGQGLAAQAGQNIAQNYLSGANTSINAANSSINAANSQAQNSLAQASLANQGFLGGLGIANNAASTLGNQYQQTLNNMTGSLSVSPSIQGMNYADAQALFGAGSTQQAQNQALINAPYTQLNNYTGAIGGNLGSQGSQTTPYYSNGIANAFGTGLGAFQLGKGLFGNQSFGDLGTSLFGPSQASNTYTSPYDFSGSVSSGFGL